LQIGLAFVCCIGAGLATIMGSSVLFVFRSPLKQATTIGASLAFASGVMIYISFVDIYIGKSVSHFEEIANPPTAFLYSTLCFFGGVLLTYVVNLLANWLASCSVPESPAVEEQHIRAKAAGSAEKLGDAESISVSMPDDTVISAAAAASTSVDRKKMLQVGLLACIAIAMHNVPEGLVTFVGYLHSIKSGVTLAVAIAIHNIPEGMVVALPIYCSTGSKFKAVLWTAVSGLTEPVGALIGLSVVCGGVLTHVAFGVMFGFVSGIMVLVSVKELLPLARRFDPEDAVCTVSTVCGMGVMAASLVAINYS